MKVILLMAQTLDGFIGRDSDHFPDWTGNADKKFFVETTKRAGVMIFGRKTYDTIGKPLPKRLNVVMTRQKSEKVGETHDNLWQTDARPQEILKKLKNLGYSEVVLAGGQQINTLFAKENLINEVWLTICPIFMGEGLRVFGSGVDMGFDLLETGQLDDKTAYIKYKVRDISD